MAFLVVLGLVLVVASASPEGARAEAEDTEPPQLVGLSIEPAEVNTATEAQVVTVTAHLTDDLSGVGPPQISFHSPGTQVTGAGSLFLVSGTETDGTYKGTVTFNRFVEPGAWKATIIIYDRVGHTLVLSPSDLEEMGLPDTVQVKSEEDTEPPQLVGLSIEPAEVNTATEAQVVTVTAHLTDDLSGVGPPQISFHSPGTQVTGAGSLFLVSGTETDGTYKGTVTFNRFVEPGAWKATIIIYDRVGHTLVLSPSDLEEMGLPDTVQVKSEEDTEPPTLTIDAQPNGENGWFTESPATVVAHAADPALTGLACAVNGQDTGIAPDTGVEVLDLEFTVQGEGRHQVVCLANDSGGNESKGVIFVLIDLTSPPPPAPSADREPDFVGPVSWYTDEVTVSFAPVGDPVLADGSPGSGVNSASIPAAITFSTSGTHIASGSAADLAGNASAAPSLVANVDATAPETILSCPEKVLLGATAVAVWNDADGESGLQGPATGSHQLDTSTVGTHVSSHAAADFVGHSASSTCQYQVSYAFAIGGKIKLPPQLNKRSGKKSEMRVEFSLGGDQGPNIFRPGFPAVRPIDCASGKAIGAQSLAGESSPLSYHPKKEMYEYSWDLGGLGGSGCVALLLGLKDDTTHEVWLAL